MRAPLFLWLACWLFAPWLQAETPKPVVDAALPTPGQESPLDQPIALPPEVTTFDYLDQIKSLQANVPKPLIFPPGFLDFVARSNLKLSCRFGVDHGAHDKTVSLRAYLDEVKENTHLAWHYDPQHDAIVLSFPWYNPGSRLGPDLVAAIVRNAPTPGPVHFSPQGASTKVWESAFNELLSQPENFPQVWKLRVAAACGAEGFPGLPDLLGDSLYVNTLKDDTGRSHLLVLIESDPIMTPGPPPFVSFYLFDADGKWEDGGSFIAGSSREEPTFKFDQKKQCATFEVIRKSETRWGYTVGSVAGKLSASTWGDFNWGYPSVSFDGSTGSMTLGLTSTDKTFYDYRISVEAGKLKVALWKDDVPANPADSYAPHFGPLKRYN